MQLLLLLCYNFGKDGRNQRGRQITIIFVGMAETSNKKLKTGDDAAEARWFDIEKLPENLAFENDEILIYEITKLKTRKICRSRKGV